MALLIFFLLLALAVSFLCSIMEAVLLSSTVSYIENKESEGYKSALILRKHKEDIDRPLSAILTINTIAHTVGAAGVGAQATALFGEAYFGLISAILTLLILVFSEIIPKTIGATYWRSLALVSANIIRWMIIISLPIVYISKLITKVVAGKASTDLISRQEVTAMANVGVVQGVLDESESQVIENLLSLRNIKVKDIMTPRTVLVTAEENMSLQAFFDRPNFNNFSRVPVYDGNPDKITGFVLKYDILEKLARDEFEGTLKDIRRPVIIVYENLPVPTLFNKLLTQREHLAVLMDEYGGLSGIATMEDIIETILGLEIVDETDLETDMQEAARERWRSRQDMLGRTMRED